MEKKCDECGRNLKQIFTCLTCYKTVCKVCETVHRRQYKNHIFTLEDLDYSKCSAHSSYYSWQYCFTCETTVCESCVLNEHRSHEIKYLYRVCDEVAEEAKKKVGSQLAEIQADKENIIRHLDVYNGKWSEYTKRVESIASFLKEEQEHINDLISKTKNMTTKGNGHQELDKFLDNVEKLSVTKIIKCEIENHLKNILSEKDPNYFVQKYKRLHENFVKIRIPDATLIEIPELIVNHVKPTREEVDNVLFRIRFGVEECKTDKIHGVSAKKFQTNENDTTYLGQNVQKRDEEISCAMKALESIGTSARQFTTNGTTEFTSQENLQKFPEIKKHVDSFQALMADIGEYKKQMQQSLNELPSRLSSQVMDEAKAHDDEKYRYQKEQSNGEIQHWKEKATELQKIVENLNKEYNDMKKTLKRSKNEADDLKTRLSQVAGAKLVAGNSSITDLSDKYRPTRIAEMYSELYDSEWTEAVDSIMKINSIWKEDYVVRHLFVVLQACFDTCQHIATEQITTLCQKLFMDVSPQDLASYMDFHVSELKQLKDARKGIAHSMTVVLKKTFFDNRRFKTICEGYKDVEWSLVQKITKTKYAEQCVMVCWFMVVQDPEMYLDKDLKPGSPFNKECYKQYTQNGKQVLYSVWPALYLQKGGPLLNKGVVQLY